MLFISASDNPTDSTNPSSEPLPTSIHLPSDPPILHIPPQPLLGQAPLQPLVAQEIGFPAVSVEHVFAISQAVTNVVFIKVPSSPYEYPFLLPTIIRDDLNVTRPSSLLRQKLY